MLAKDELNLSARNIIKGEILEINLGEINPEVSLGYRWRAGFNSYGDISFS